MIPRFSVSNFIAIVNQTFDVAFAGMVEVEGEVSSFKSYPPKYAFFDLKDDDGLVRCFVGFSNLRTPIEDGMKVVVRAMPALRDKGAFSLNVQEIRPLGKGSLKRSFDLLLRVCLILKESVHYRNILRGWLLFPVRKQQDMLTL